MQDLLDQLGHVASDWKTLGALAGAVALVNLLITLTKMASAESAPGWLRKVFGRIKPAWRSWIALGLGVLSGFLGSLAAGKSLSEALAGAVLGGLLGLGASGAHEAIAATKPTEKAKKEAAAMVAAALDGPEHEVDAKVEELKARLDKAKAEPDKKKRLQAMAALARKK